MANDWKIKIKCEKQSPFFRDGNKTVVTARFFEAPIDFQAKEHLINCPLCGKDIELSIDLSQKYLLNDCELSLKKKIKEALVQIIIGIIISLIIGYLAITYQFNIFNERLFDLLFFGFGVLCMIGAFYLGLTRLFRYTYFLFRLSRSGESYFKKDLPLDVIYSKGNLTLKTIDLIMGDKTITTKNHSFLKENDTSGSDKFYYYGLPKKGLVKNIDPKW